MVGIDGTASNNGSDWFCYHASSHAILPINFCKKNDIPLTVPQGKKKKKFLYITSVLHTYTHTHTDLIHHVSSEICVITKVDNNSALYSPAMLIFPSPILTGYDPQTFVWETYLSETKAKAVPARLFNTVRQEAALCLYSPFESIHIQMNGSSSILQLLCIFPPGLPWSLLLPQPEAGGSGSDESPTRVRCYCEAVCRPPAAHPLRRLGGRVRPVGGSPVPRHLPCWLV